MMSKLVVYVATIVSVLLSTPSAHQPGEPFGLITKKQTDCEMDALVLGGRLADAFNSFDEATERDVRLHHDYLAENLGFVRWMQSGLWKNTGLTADRKSAKEAQQKGKWIGSKKMSESAYAPLENRWVYMLGDSTLRQIWASYVATLHDNDFEGKAKEWSREQCDKQYPHRAIHPDGGSFPVEGWSGRCGVNEVTCHMDGLGHGGKFTYDWKHFPWEDYDEWLFSEDGVWPSPENNKDNKRIPDVLVLQVGLHTCVHAVEGDHYNETMIHAHERNVHVLMKAIDTAVKRAAGELKPESRKLEEEKKGEKKEGENVDREKEKDGVSTLPESKASGNPQKTTVIVSISGRHMKDDGRQDKCSWHINRVVTHQAHKHGFVVLEREEIEHRLLYRSEHNPDIKAVNPDVHLDIPGPQIVGTALLKLLECITKNESEYKYVVQDPFYTTIKLD